MFVYVFKKEDRDLLLRLGYSLHKNNEANNIYVFDNDEIVSIEELGIDFTYSNKLTF